MEKYAKNGFIHFTTLQQSGPSDKEHAAPVNKLLK